MFTVLLRKVCCTEGYTERLTLSSYKKFESKKCLKKNRKYVKEKFATTRDIACTQFVLRYWVPVLSTACTEYRDYRGITKKFERNAPVLSTVYSMYGVQGLQEHHEEVWKECSGAKYCVQHVRSTGTTGASRRSLRGMPRCWVPTIYVQQVGSTLSTGTIGASRRSLRGMPRCWVPTTYSK